ncbi:DUF7269 family protein [Halorientalis litorea]|jgi:hypothetical protein|uniref:DUF7269 family protein n=1 Tax=Halorientalis litorea TaxID=2931977 RepID=UPI001FF46CBD|nr:hypothetical protein [Halorientalis litorea]
MIRTTLVVALGAVALALAALAGFAPGLLPGPVRSVLADVPAVESLGRVASLVAVATAGRWLWASSSDSLPPMPTNDDVEAHGPVAGDAFDRHLSDAGAVGEQTAEAEARVRSDLRRLAIDVYEQAARCDRSTAALAVESGTWTDDPAAAAFVGGPEAPSVPWRVWVRDALSDEGPFHRQTVRTLRAIDALGDDTAREGADTPDTDPDAVAADGSADTTEGHR